MEVKTRISTAAQLAIVIAQAQAISYGRLPPTSTNRTLHSPCPIAVRSTSSTNYTAVEQRGRGMETKTDGLKVVNSLFLQIIYAGMFSQHGEREHQFEKHHECSSYWTYLRARDVVPLLVLYLLVGLRGSSWWQRFNDGQFICYPIKCCDSTSIEGNLNYIVYSVVPEMVLEVVHWLEEPFSHSLLLALFAGLQYTYKTGPENI